MVPSCSAQAEILVAGLAVLLLTTAAHGIGLTEKWTSDTPTWPVRLVELTGAMIFCWYLCLFADWTLHKLGHWRIRGNKIYETHMRHHKRKYPCGKLLQPGPYQGDGGETAFMPPVVLIWSVIFNVLPTRIAAPVVLCSSVFLLASDHLHSQYHVSDSWLEPYLGEWFLERRKYHFHHHHSLQENMSLGGFSTIFDRLFGSYWDAKARAKARK